MHKIIVTNQQDLIQLQRPGLEVVTPKQYISRSEFAKRRNTRVFNLCRDYSYQSKGYYVSLLAEARGHRPIPDVKRLQDIKSLSIVRSISEDMDELIQKSLKKIRSNEFILSVYFGKNVSAQYDRISAELHRSFAVPLLRARFIKNEKWTLQSIRPIAMKDVPAHHQEFMLSSATEFFSKKRFDNSKGQDSKFDLAILVQPGEEAAPSNKKALQKFKEASERNAFSVEFITRDDLPRLSEFDAMFIRTTTNVNHYTYRMARTAESLGLTVIDDPSSILKCSNKVYLAELLRNARIPSPHTMIIHSDNRKEVLAELALPCILKLPDSSFSLGVIKVETEEQLNSELRRMLDQSELVIGQRYAPTDFDWRIGVLNGKALFACKYFMAKDHWQIYNWKSDSVEEIEGNFQTLNIDDVPPAIVEMSEKATALIGNGLYGVDIKEVDGKPLIIEINDNPNIDAGVEDQLLGDRLYEAVVLAIQQRILNRLGIKSIDNV